MKKRICGATPRAFLVASSLMLLASANAQQGAPVGKAPLAGKPPVADVSKATVAAVKLPPGPQAMPDLAFKSFKRAGAKIEAVAVNIGEAPASLRTTATVSIMRAGEPTQSESVFVPALAPGDSFALPFTLTAPGAFQISLDTGQALAESNEKNNVTPIKASPTRGAANRRPGALASATSFRAKLGQRYVSADGTVQPLAAAAMPDGRVVIFPENELTLRTSSKTEAEQIAARIGGVIIDRIDAPAGWSWGSLYVIRVNAAPASKAQLSAREQQTIFSSDAARNLLTLAKTANAKGARLGVNLIAENNDIFSGITMEANNGNGLSLDYMQAGGVYDVDVETAWKMLQHANKLSTKPIRLGILDGGFGVPRSDWLEKDLDIEATNDASGPNKSNCSGGAGCPWHGVNAAEAAAGLHDDKRGTTGPASPVAKLLLFDRGGGDTATSIKRLWKLNESLPHIINMSFGGRTNRDEVFFEGAWKNIVEDFEEATVEISGKGNRLLFASAGNDSFDIDQVNEDGDEAHWVYPCENQGVICVGGWRDWSDGAVAADECPECLWYGAPPPKPSGDITLGKWGKEPAVNSNFSSAPRGETVDIWGPWCTRVGDDMNNKGANATKTYCGTSAATPVVSGVAALVWAANPGLSAASVWGILNKHAIAAGSIRRVHAREAVREALKTTGQKFAPKVTITSPIEGKIFAPGATIFAAHEDFDIEDGDKCCAVSWFLNGALAAQGGANAASAKLDLSKLKPGDHTARVVVEDSDKNSTFADAKFKIVNKAPDLDVKFLGPAGFKMFKSAPYGYDVKITDDSFPIGVGPDECKKVVWQDSAGAMTVQKKSGCRFSLRFMTPGARTVTVAYTDPYGGSATTSFNVNIENPVGLKVYLLEPMGGESYAPSEPVIVSIETMNATGPVTYKFFLTNMSSKISKEITPMKLAEGKYSFTIAEAFPDLIWSTASPDLRLDVQGAVGGAVSDAFVVISSRGAIK